MNRRSRAAYGALLRMLPEEFVRENGREMQAAFRDRLDVAPHHPLGFLRVWFSAGTDVVRGAPKVWMRTWRMRRRNEPKRPTKAIGMLEILFHDLRLALHSLAGTPGPTAVVVITLILGIGANTAVFSVINGVVLRPFDYPEPERLFVVDAVWQARSDEPVPHVGGNFQLVERQASGFQSMVAMTDVRQNLLGANGAEQITVGWVSRGLFDVTGVSPVLGRGFEESDTPNTVLLSYGLWQSYFGGDPEVLGETVDLDARPVTIIGVLPPAFRIHLPPSYSWPARIDLWKPPDPQWSNGDLWNMQQLQAAAFKVIGRAAPGVTHEQLDTELATIAGELRDMYQEHATADFQLRARPLHAATVGEVSAGLYTLFGAVLLVLLITCANVANVMLVRSESRKRQLAVRVALGGSRGRITTMLLAESAVLSVIGTIGGVGLAVAGLDALIALSPSNLPRAELITIDGAVLAFAIAVSAACTIGFGLLPAFQGSRTDPLHALQSTPRGATSHGWLANRLLVTLEVAISFALLTGAGLMLRTFAALEDVRPGFDHEQLLTFSASIPGTDYQAPAETHRFFDELTFRNPTCRTRGGRSVAAPARRSDVDWELCRP